MKKRRTVDDVSKEEIVEVLEPAMDCLHALMFRQWLNPGDGSDRDVTEALIAAFKKIGVTVGTIREFEANIESILKCNLPPNEWWALTPKQRKEREKQMDLAASRRAESLPAEGH